MQSVLTFVLIMASLALALNPINGQAMSIEEYNSGMMPEIVISAQHPSSTTSQTNQLNTTDHILIIIANALIVTGILIAALREIFINWYRQYRLNKIIRGRRKGKRRFMLPPFPKNNNKIGKEFACQSEA